MHFDVEIPAIMNQALASINAGPVFTKINNRKILEGYYSGLDMENTSEAIRLIDKVDKIGFDGVADLLKAELELNSKTIDKIFQLTQIHGSGQQVVDQIQNLGVHSELLDQGLTELTFVMQELEHIDKQAFAVDLSIARGLAYYTGTVYETRFAEYPAYPSICGGGRYDNLVGDFVSKRLPGIGISIGLSRIFAKLLKEKRINTDKKSPTEILVIHSRGAPYRLVNKTAQTLRQRGFNLSLIHI